MATESFEVSTYLPAPPWRVYEAWLDGTEHGLFTGGPATSEPAVGGAFTAWEGYIQGTYLVLEPGERIVHAWRTTDFPAGAPDSRVEVLFEAARGGTRLTVVHAQIPSGQEGDYQAGWSAFYFRPMKKYFQSAAKTAPAKRRHKVVKAKPAAPARRRAKRPAGKKARRSR